MRRNDLPQIDRLEPLDWVLTSAVFVGTFVLLMATMGIGVPRDESFYFHAALEYYGWFDELWRNIDASRIADSFEQRSVDRHFSYNPEHPALMKILFGLSHALFHDKLEWTSSIVAMRIPAVAFASMLSGVVFLFGRHLYGRGAGVLAVALLLLQPRYFFHAHLACFDIPVIAVWSATFYAYWRSWSSQRWAIATGLLWGLGLSVKLNAFFLPIVLGAHWLWVVVSRIRRHGWHRPPIPWPFVWMAILGPLLFFGLWPRHWFDTIERVTWYMRFHLEHVHYFVYFFGQNIQQPPFPVSYPWVMTALTVPATILLAFVAGVTMWRRRSSAAYDDRGTWLLVAIAILFPIALISMPTTPIFGGVKHWMAANVFLAIVAAGGAMRCAEALTIWWASRTPLTGLAARVTASLLIAAAVALPALTMSIENHPFGTSYYNELIGSYRGAADARMMRQFWGYSSRYALDWLNEDAPENARVFLHNTTTQAWRAYQRDELVRDDFRATPASSSTYALYHHQKAFVYVLTGIWEAYDTKVPAHVVDIDGVPVLSVYRR